MSDRSDLARSMRAEAKRLEDCADNYDEAARLNREKAKALRIKASRHEAGADRDSPARAHPWRGNE